MKSEDLNPVARRYDLEVDGKPVHLYYVLLIEGAASFPMGYAFWTLVDEGETVVDWVCSELDTGQVEYTEAGQRALLLDAAVEDGFDVPDLESRLAGAIRAIRERVRAEG